MIGSSISVKSHNFQTDDVTQKLSEAWQLYDKRKYSEAFAIYEPLAKNGNARAQRWLGAMYRHGNHVERDFTMALNCYVKAAKHGDSKLSEVALKMIEETVITVQGIKQENPDTEEGITPEAVRELEDVCNKIGKMYRTGSTNNVVDREKARKWDDMAYALGTASRLVENAENECEVELLSKASTFIEKKEFVAAYIIYAHLAKQGNAEALFQLAQMYDEEQGLVQDEKKLFGYCEKAASQGHPKAAFLMACFSLDGGHHLGKDVKKAEEFTKIAAENGYPKAAFVLAGIYFDEDDKYLVKDVKKAEEFAKMALENGYLKASFALEKIREAQSETTNAETTSSDASSSDATSSDTTSSETTCAEQSEIIMFQSLPLSSQVSGEGEEEPSLSFLSDDQMMSIAVYHYEKNELEEAYKLYSILADKGVAAAKYFAGQILVRNPGSAMAVEKANDYFAEISKTV